MSFTFYNELVKGNSGRVQNRKEAEYMTAIMKREIKNYLKRPWFWLGMAIVIFGVFQILEPYMNIRYLSSEQEIIQNLPVAAHDGDLDLK